MTPAPKKIKSRRQSNVLTALAVKHLAAPGLYADGGCLFVEVDEYKSKRWVVRVVRRMTAADGTSMRGTRHDLGLGSTSLTTLDDARQEAAALRRAAMAGQDVVALNRAKRRPAPIAPSKPTFEQIAEKVFEVISPTLKEGKARNGWMSPVRSYAFPVIGSLPIDEVSQPLCLRILQPIWLEKSETARKLKYRMGTILDWSKAHGYRTGDSPLSGIQHGLAKQIDKTEHLAAMAIDDVPGFFVGLRSFDFEISAKLALEFLVLNVNRSSEVRFAEWAEIDMKAKLWTVPANRMKAGEPHVVPLADRSIEILQELLGASSRTGLIFKTHRSKAHDENKLTKLAKAVSGDEGLTIHGFRSTFRNWVPERTSFDGDLADFALAHAIKDKVKAAYMRTKLLDKRRDLATAWANFVTSGKVFNQQNAAVVAPT